MGMGLFASVATIVRIKYIPTYGQEVDHLYGVAPLVLWSTIEVGMGVIAVCLSALGPLVSSVLGDSHDESSNDEPSPPTIGARRSKGYMRARIIRLRNINDGLSTTMVTGVGNNNVSNYNGSINHNV